ncbi:diguanylate cyclase (GGDEF) domain-containing protein [Succinivibrio dextrinosolvens DSM 3072]|uniref:diguanylate cyclase n=1 Tax=Succinivibrio dextrinosolvens DSM 3072 TaxID=1123324 RepID=A0A1T4V9D7_9GAMM|nr:GGDEF domain-containing protein [Succinivibrio dextrinosolvens]SKA61575.1 diguanylate cyclase (GGDEF) domain-containing protein [Succinivibrio dextrinosolvens DSM 3072]
MLSFSFVTDNSLLYFVVICMLILFSVIHHDKDQLNSSTKISINVSYLLLLHSIAYAAFCVLFYVNERYSLGNIKAIRFALVLLGLLTNYISFVYPYLFLFLIRQFHNRCTFVRGRNFVIFTGFFVLCTLMFFAAIGYTTCLVYLEAPLSTLFLHNLDDAIVFAGIISFVVALPDFNRFIYNLLQGTFYSKKAIIVALFAILYLQLILLPLNFMFYAPVMYMFSMILVYVIHVTSQQKQISVDFLTGMNNRNSLMKYLERLFVKRSELDGSFKLLVITIDNFKNLNNNYGHDEGDKMLIKVADILKQSAPTTGLFLCRFMRDQFVAVMHETPEFGVTDYIDRLNKNAEGFNNVRDVNFELSLSVGYVAYSHDLKDIDSFISEAEENLYRQQELKRINRLKEQTLSF